jgi:hypothetical protein
MIRSTEGKTMKNTPAITCLFLDIGGVLLTNGWDHHARKRAATHFKLERVEMEDRHRLNVATYEEGKLTLKEYLGQVVFYQKRPFTLAQFRRFMFAQSKPYPPDDRVGPEAQGNVRVEDCRGQQRRARTEYLSNVDAWISSCFVHLRKPDAAIFRLALDIAQAPVRQVVYIDNTQMFVQIAEALGIRSILHTDYQATCAKLASFGLQHHAGVSHTTS